MQQLKWTWLEHTFKNKIKVVTKQALERHDQGKSGCPNNWGRAKPSGVNQEKGQHCNTVEEFHVSAVL